MRFGLGAWSKIIRANCLPGKNPSQLNLQTQRMMGQQSLGGKSSVGNRRDQFRRVYGY